jgi:glycosyltransferase involved in cell wall biosynthesis
MTTPHRIAYVCTDPGVPVFGSKGSSMHVRSMLTELTRRGNEVHLFAARRGGPTPSALSAVTIHALARPGGPVATRERLLIAADAQLAEKLMRTSGDCGFDLVYQRYGLWSCEGLEVAAANGWPSVLEINAPLLDEQTRHRQLLDREAAEDRTRRAIEAARAAFGVSRAAADWAATRCGRAVAVIPNGVDTERFTPVRPPRGVGDPVVIGFVGTFKPWHDLDVVVDSAAALHFDPEAPPIRVMLVGDGPELQRVLERAAAIGLGDVVDSSGAVDSDEIPSLLARMHVALAPYDGREPYFSPIKVFEYLAAGLPTVVSGIGDLDGLLVDEREALVVPPGDRRAHLAALRRLCLDGALRERMGLAARSAAVSRFGWHHTADRVLELVGESVSA